MIDEKKDLGNAKNSHEGYEPPKLVTYGENNDELDPKGWVYDDDCNLIWVPS